MCLTKEWLINYWCRFGASENYLNCAAFFAWIYLSFIDLHYFYRKLFKVLNENSQRLSKMISYSPPIPFIELQGLIQWYLVWNPCKQSSKMQCIKSYLWSLLHMGSCSKPEEKDVMLFIHFLCDIWKQNYVNIVLDGCPTWFFYLYSALN